MRVLIQRLMHDNDTSISSMYIDKEPACWILEDEPREEKVSKETRIPASSLEIVIRCEGRIYNKYIEKHKSVHKTPEYGMLCIVTPGNKEWKIITDKMTFQYVMIHIGNHDDHTEGCPLTGSRADHTNFERDRIDESTKAYYHIYPIIIEELLAGNRVFIDFKDEEELF